MGAGRAHGAFGASCAGSRVSRCADAPTARDDTECVAGGFSSPASRRFHPNHADMRDVIRTSHAVRLGFRQVKGLREGDMRALVSVRDKGYDSVRDLWLRSGLSRNLIERLADADAFRSLGLERRDALWAARALEKGKTSDRLPLFDTADLPDLRKEPDADLPPMPLGEHVVNDYRYLTLSLKAHPVSFVRDVLRNMRVVPAQALRQTPSGRFVSVAGLVLVRQRPGSAKGVVFMTIEDESGVANVIVWPKVFEKFRALVLGARFVRVRGPLQSDSGVIHVVAREIADMTGLLSVLSADAGDMEPYARADEVKRPVEETRQLPGHHARMSALRPLIPGRGAAALTETAISTDKVLPKGRNFQ